MSVNNINGPQSGGLEKDTQEVSAFRNFVQALVFASVMSGQIPAKANDLNNQLDLELIKNKALAKGFIDGTNTNNGFIHMPLKATNSENPVIDIEKIGNIKTAKETSTFNTSSSGFSAQSNNGEIKQRFSTNVGASTSTTKDSLSDSEQDKIESPSKNGGKTVTNNAQIEGLTDWGSWQANIGLVNQMSENEKSATIREASISFLYNAAKAETMIKVAKGSDFEKILIAQGISLGEGGKLALNVSKLSQILNYNFDSYGSKDVSMEQNTYGIKYTYPAKMGFLEELRTKVIYYDVKGKELGTIKDIIINNATEYDWTEINGAVQGGTALRGIAEVVLKLDEKVKLTLGVGLDKTKYEAILDRAAETQTKVTGSVNLEWLVNNYNNVKLFLYENPNDTRFGAKLTHLFDAGFTGYIQLEQDSYKNNIGRDSEVKGMVGFNYTFGKGAKKLPSLYNQAGDTSLKHGESLISEVDNNYISGPNRAIAQKMHIVFVDKTLLLAGDGITVDPITQKLTSIYYDNGGNVVTSISGLSDTSYSNFFFVENGKLTIKNFRDLAYKMAKDGIALGSTKTIDVGVIDAGGNSIYDVKIVKGSAEFKNVTRRIFGVTTAVMNAFVNGTLDPQIKEDLLNSVLTPAVVDGIVTGIINQTRVNQYKNGDLTATDLANLLHPDHTAPTANGETVSTAYNTALNGINVLANDSDNSGTVILGNIYSQVGGVFTKSGNLINFTPTNGFSGSASCIYQVKDPTGNTSTATLTINVAAAPDTTPNVFDIPNMTDQALNTVVTTNAITVSGINASTSVSTNVGTLIINGTDTGLSSSNVTNGQTVAVKLTTSATNSTAINGTLTIGGVVDNFSVTTIAIAPDTTPNSFDIPNMTDQALNTVVTTNAITVSGINASTSVSTNVGTLVINGTDTGLSSSNVTNGQTVAVKLTTSATNSTAINGTLTIGGVVDNFSVTTIAIAPDTTPDAFSFTDVTGQALSTLVESGAITVAGINTASTISVSAGGEYSINGGAWTNVAGTVTNGQTVKVRHTTSATNSTQTDTILTIGGVSDIFSTTTLALLAPSSAPGSLDMTTGTDSGTDTTDNITNLNSTFTWASVGTATSYEVKLNTGSRTDVGNVLTYTTSGLSDATHTFYVRAKNAGGTGSESSMTFTKDTITPNTPSWTAGVITKSTAYTARKVTLAVGASGISATGLSVTAGGTISNVSVSGGVVTFDYTTPNAVGDTITISGTSVAGTAFSTTIDTPALSSPVDAEKPNTPTITINSGATYTNNTNVNISITGDTDNVGVTGWFVSESSSVPALGSFVAEPTTTNISSGDGTKTLYVFTRDAAGNISLAGSDTITLDTITPNTPSWTVGGVTLKNTSYTARKVTLAVGPSGINPTGLSVTAGGTISNVSVSGGEITFDYTTPNAVGDTITISGTSVAGTAFSTTIDTPALSAANTAPVVSNIADTSGGNTYFGGDNHRETTVDMSSYISDDITADSGLTFNYTGNAGISSIDTSAWPTIKIIGNIGWSGDRGVSYTVTDAGGLTSNTGTIHTNW